MGNFPSLIQTKGGKPVVVATVGEVVGVIFVVVGVGAVVVVVLAVDVFSAVVVSSVKTARVVVVAAAVVVIAKQETDVGEAHFKRIGSKRLFAGQTPIKSFPVIHM